MRLKADHGDRRGGSDELYLHYDLMSGIIRVANDWQSYNQLIEDITTKMLMKSMEENDDTQPANDQP
jgi:hypothetical protein